MSAFWWIIAGVVFVALLILAWLMRDLAKREDEMRKLFSREKVHDR